MVTLKKPDGSWKKRKKAQRKAATNPHKRSKATEPESAIQARAEEYLAIRGVQPIRLPDILMKSFFNAQGIPIYTKRIVKEYLKGLPDLIIPKRCGKYTIVLPLEIKTEVGKLTNEQKVWQEILGTKVTYGWEPTLEAMQSFLDEEVIIIKKPALS